MGGGRLRLLVGVLGDRALVVGVVVVVADDTAVVGTKDDDDDGDKEDDDAWPGKIPSPP